MRAPFVVPPHEGGTGQGLLDAEGHETRWGAVVRSDAPERLTSAGRSALTAHDIRTIIDLRNDDDRQNSSELRATDVDIVHTPLEDLTDTEFWEHWGKGLHGTPADGILDRPAPGLPN
ncbi:tyrosine-protein phosphatase [Streptosporangium sp. NPDC000396]|uniref:tyrosine-protein phosphatase n=1 Tax=Streptosporangium sp. NPDC000396 TaxID=3366185 RepID=UPI0036BFB364